VAGCVRWDQPDAVLLDIRMPDVDGLTILRELRMMPDALGPAMLTTFDAAECIPTALNSGTAVFLLKDNEPEQLAHPVRTWPQAAWCCLPSVPDAAAQPSRHRGPSTKGNLRPAAHRPRARRPPPCGREAVDRRHRGHVHLGAGTVKDHVSAILTKLRV
jgi:DNA-binding NarL/FixJ family response regulator